jgi:hypothetical protein
MMNSSPAENVSPLKALDPGLRFVAAPEPADEALRRVAVASPSFSNSAKVLLKTELLPPQHKPAHVQICQQW